MIEKYVGLDAFPQHHRTDLPGEAPLIRRGYDGASLARLGRQATPKRFIKDGAKNGSAGLKLSAAKGDADRVTGTAAVGPRNTIDSPGIRDEVAEPLAPIPGNGCGRKAGKVRSALKFDAIRKDRPVESRSISGHAVVQGNVVLNLDIIANCYTRHHYDILSNIAVISNA